MATPGEPHARDQAGRAGPDDRDAHGRSPLALQVLDAGGDALAATGSVAPERFRRLENW
jgi:hypothetical protein